MKTLALTLLVSLALPIPFAQAAREVDCIVRMQNSAVYEIANEVGRPVQDVFLLRSEMGMWTEAVGENLGSAEVAVKVGGATRYYRVDAKQIGTSIDCNVLRITKLDPSSIDPLAKQAEKYRNAIGTEVYMSETDSEWFTFYSDVYVSDLSERSLQSVFGSSMPIDVWSQRYTLELFENNGGDGEASNETIWRYKRLLEAFQQDFTDFRVIKVGEEDGGTLEIYILGRRADGKVVGLRAITVET